MSVPILDLTPLGPSPPQRFPLGVPIKIANINEKLNARGGGGGEEDGWEEGKGPLFSLFPSHRGGGEEDGWEEGKEPLFSLFPSHRAPGCFPFLSFQPPCDTKRQISRGDTLYGARTFQYKPTSISSPHQTGIKLNFKRRRVEKPDFYLAENTQLILENKNDTSRLDFSHDYKYLQKA